MPELLPIQHSLNTDRLNLEILQENHADEMFNVLQDPRTYQYMDGRPENIEQLRQRYAKQSSNWHGRPVSWHNWVIREKNTNQAIGYIQATLDHREHSAELAWVVSPLWTGKKYASEAARRIMQEIDETGLVRTFTCTIDHRNAPSRNLAQSLGFALTNPEPVEDQTWTMEPRKRKA